MKTRQMSETKSVEDKQEPPSFEDVLEELGPLGRFERTQIFFCYLANVTLGFMVLSYVFHGYEPPHRCNAVNETNLLADYHSQNDSTAHVMYKACEIQIYTNDSGNMVKVDTLDCPNGRDFSDAKHTTFLSEWDLVCESKGVAEFSQTLFNIGQLVGGLFASPISDRFGRKPVLIGSSFAACLVEFMQVAAPNIFVIYGLKFLSGIFYQALVCNYYIYGMEFVLPRHREANGVIMCSLWVVSLLLVGTVAYFLRNNDWQYLQGAVGISGLLFLFYPCFLYESPRWLAANDKMEQALSVLEKASKTNGKDFQRIKELFMNYITYAFPSSKTEPLKMSVNQDQKVEDKIEFEQNDVEEREISTLTLFRLKSLRSTTLISCFIFATNVFTYYGLYMSSSKIAGNRFLNFILMTAVELPCCLCVLVMMKKMTRRLAMEIFLGLTAVSLMSSALLISFGEGLVGASAATTALFILGKFAITGSFNVLFIILPEFYSTNLRTTAFGICSGAGRIGAMIAPYINPLFNIVQWGPALIFTVMCGLAVILTTFLPNMKDENLPDTVEDVKKKGSKTSKL